MPDDTGVPGRTAPDKSLLDDSTIDYSEPHDPPVKPSNRKPLPPIHSTEEVLNVTKRRKLELEAPDDGRIGSQDLGLPSTPIPAKHDSGASRLSKQPAKRVPSLQDSPIPLLSPPADRNRSVTSPVTGIDTREADIKSLKREALQLDQTIKKLQKQLDTVKQAKRYIQKNDDSKLEALVEKWREAAQNAADIIARDAETRISEAGGLEKFRREMLQRKMQFLAPLSFQETESTEMDAEQQETFNRLKEEYDKQVNLLQEDRGTEIADEGDATLRFVLQCLNIEYRDIFP